jgi:hypothetical protein
LTLFPFTTLIRYHVGPETDLPVHVVRQFPPATLATTVTLAPLLMAVRILAVVDGVVRRLALQMATLVTVAPKTVPGAEIAETLKTRKAETIAVASRTDGRLVRLAA